MLTILSMDKLRAYFVKHHNLDAQSLKSISKDGPFAVNMKSHISQGSNLKEVCNNMQYFLGYMIRLNFCSLEKIKIYSILSLRCPLRLV